jgi:hypothetical protein
MLTARKKRDIRDEGRVEVNNYTNQQDFVPRKVYCVSNVTFHAESKYTINIFPSPTVFFVTAKLNVQYWSATLYDSAVCLAP